MNYSKNWWQWIYFLICYLHSYPVLPPKLARWRRAFEHLLSHFWILATKAKVEDGAANFREAKIIFHLWWWVGTYPQKLIYEGALYSILFFFTLNKHFFELAWILLIFDVLKHIF